MITGQTSQLFELIAMAPAHLQLTPIVEHEQVIAPLQRLELLYEIEVHDGATMNAPEFLWIETLFDRVDRRTDAKTLAVAMDLHVVSSGREVVDLADRLKKDSILRTDNDLFRILPDLGLKVSIRLDKGISS